MQVNEKERIRDSFSFFFSNKKKREREKKQRRRITPTSWSVVRYVVYREVGKMGGREEMDQCYMYNINS